MRIELKTNSSMVVELDSGDRFYLRDDLGGVLHLVAMGVHHRATSKKLELYNYDPESGQDVMLPGGQHCEIGVRVAR